MIQIDLDNLVVSLWNLRGGERLLGLKSLGETGLQCSIVGRQVTIILTWHEVNSWLTRQIDICATQVGQTLIPFLVGLVGQVVRQHGGAIRTVRVVLITLLILMGTRFCFGRNLGLLCLWNDLRLYELLAKLNFRIGLQGIFGRRYKV